MRAQLVSPPVEFPVTLDEARAFCRVDGPYEDQILQLLIAAACQAAEKFTGLLIGEQTWRVDFIGMAAELDLPIGPVSALSAISYRDIFDTALTMADGDYILDAVGRDARLLAREGLEDVATARREDAVSATVAAGYDDASLPAPIKLAILGMVAQWFDNRVPGAMPKGCEDMLWPYRRIEL